MDEKAPITLSLLILHGNSIPNPGINGTVIGLMLYFLARKKYNFIINQPLSTTYVNPYFILL